MEITPIGVLESCFEEKFGTPRQAGLAPSARAVLRLPAALREAVRRLDEFSHVWLITHLNRVPEEGSRLTARPPRLGGNQRIGSLATRSPFRPNPIGLSAVRLIAIEHPPDAVLLHLAGADLVDGTPVLDLKPYLPYADAIPEATGAWAAEAPERIPVRYTESVEIDDETRALLDEVLGLDPRPAIHATRTRRRYGLRIAGWDVSFRVVDGVCLVSDVERAP